MRSLQDGITKLHNTISEKKMAQFAKDIFHRDRIHKLAILVNREERPLIPTADYVFSYAGSGTEQDMILLNIYINMIAVTFRKNK